MQRRLATMVLFLAATSVSANELVMIPAFQDGPLGACPVFDSATIAEAEARVASTMPRATTLELGAATPLGRDVSFSASARTLQDERAAGRRADVAAGPLVWFGALGVGGAVGAAFLAETARPAPMATAYVGWRDRGLTAAVQHRRYDSDSEATPPPSTTALRSRYGLMQELDLGLDLSTTDGRWSVAGGGVYKTPVGVNLATSYRYAEPKDGASRLGVGCAIAAAAFTLQFDIGYETSKPAGADSKAWDIASSLVVPL